MTLRRNAPNQLGKGGVKPNICCATHLDSIFRNMRLGLLPRCTVSLLLISVGWSADVQLRSLAQFSEDDLRTLASKPDPIKHLDPYNPEGHLYKILIPRPRMYILHVLGYNSLLTLCASLADTDNNTFVRQHLVKTLKDLKWHVEEDKFTDNTPYGEKRFTNVIATKDPNAPRRVILSAHFDSKFFPTAPLNQVRV
jgi:glutaminyl-peptide cyclotransferase